MQCNIINEQHVFLDSHDTVKLVAGKILFIPDKNIWFGNIPVNRKQYKTIKA
jgi:hypothetical protein